MKILSIETSCDDTAVAIVEYDDGQAKILANTVSSQIELHAKWGGVVPALASREHMNNIVPVIKETLERAKCTPQDIDLIAVTKGPGLMPALIIGVSAAKTLALVWEKPLIGIHHIEGHIYANFIGSQNIEYKLFPLVALVVSGGHTQLVLMQDHFQYEILGETLDDAAGEAFDKVARLLGLPYPGGPAISAKAGDFRLKILDLGTKEKNKEIPVKTPEGNSKIINLKSKISFPRPMINSDDFDFSFSGLKTAVLYFLKKHEAEMKNKTFINEICYEFQESVVDVLVAKTKKALTLYSPQTFVIAGGVSANIRLRERLQSLIENDFPQTEFLTPEFAYSLDNAAMIGIAAAFRYDRMSDAEKSALRSNVLSLDPDANLILQ